MPDLLAPQLRVVFVGINPGLYSAAIGHHFGRPGNRFWPVLHAAGFTSRLLHPTEESELLTVGYGITNIVSRATATAAELTATELIEGGRHLQRKIRRFQPVFVAFLGVTAYRTAFQRPQAVVGRQEESLGESHRWILPNPSGLNAHYQFADLVRLFTELRTAATDSAA